MRALKGQRVRSTEGTLIIRGGFLILSSVLALGFGGWVPSSFADSTQLEDRDRALDWALGGLEQGSRITRPTGARAPAGARTTPGSKVSPADAGTSRSGRAAAGAGIGVRGAGTGGLSGAGTSQPPSRGGQTPVGGGTESGTEPGGTGGTGETTSGAETTESGLGIHGEVGTSEGELNVGTQVETTETTLEAGTEIGTGAETGPELGGQVDVTETTEESGTELVGSAELTSPGTIGTSTATELDSNLSGGGNDISVDSDAEAEPIGDDADDCSLLGLISCPSFP